MTSAVFLLQMWQKVIGSQKPTPRCLKGLYHACSVDENGAFIDIGAKAAAFLPTSNISAFKIPRVGNVNFGMLQTKFNKLTIRQ